MSGPPRRQRLPRRYGRRRSVCRTGARRQCRRSLSGPSQDPRIKSAPHALPTILLMETPPPPPPGIPPSGWANAPPPPPPKWSPPRGSCRPGSSTDVLPPAAAANTRSTSCHAAAVDDHDNAWDAVPFYDDTQPWHTWQHSWVVSEYLVLHVVDRKPVTENAGADNGGACRRRRARSASRRPAPPWADAQQAVVEEVLELQRLGLWGGTVEDPWAALHEIQQNM